MRGEREIVITVPPCEGEAQMGQYLREIEKFMEQRFPRRTYGWAIEEREVLEDAVQVH